MSMPGSTFNKAAYDSCDRKSKTLLVEVLTRCGFTKSMDMDKELYKDGDVIVKDNETNEKITWECEVRQRKYYDKIIKGGFKTIHIPYRKKTNPADYYVVFPDTYDEMLIIKMESIKQSKVIDCFTTRGDDRFFDVDKNLANRYKINSDYTIIGEGKL